MFETLSMLNLAKKTTKLVFLDAIGSDPTQPRKIPEPYSMHTGFNPSKSGYIQQHLEDCGPMHNDCDGGSYMDEDYNRAGFY
mmetsp:Transcript_6310/g.12778  ORF Transcript_6310/g.12778 Transcript_6310/m.12778 type:complete len:82 (+) Transcript_6310:71-316(+)